MNKLVFLDWTGDERIFEFVVWKSGRKASSFRDSTAFVLDDGRPQALQLRLPPVRLKNDPFPEHPPTRIEKFRLRPPLCRPQPPAKWETSEVLYPGPKDEPELKAGLKLYLRVHRNDYKERRADAANLKGEQKVAQEKLLELIYHGPPLGILNTTLANVKMSNVGGIRDGILHKRWAKENALDLDEMAQDTQAIMNWPALTQVVADAQLAQVFYRIHFNNGDRFWLSSCQLRDLLDIEEAREFDDFLSRGGQKASDKPNRPLSRGRTNDDYSVVHLRRSDGKPDPIAIPRALRYLLRALDEADGRTLASPELTERITDLMKADRAEIQDEEYRPQKTLNSKAAKRLLKEGVLAAKGSLKQRVYKLNPLAP